MSLKKYRPLSPDPYVNKLKGDTEFARLAHLNDLVNQIDVAIDNIPVTRLSDLNIKNMTISSGGVLLNEIDNGAITDGVLPKTLGGAMTTATISKVGNFDKLAVTGGNQTSNIRFDNIWLSDSGTRIRISVKVENLNKDGVTGTSYLGLMGYGLQFTWDTGSTQNWGAVGELIGKGMGFYNFGNNYSAANTLTTSAGTLVANGDILDVELLFNPYNPGCTFKITNRTSGEYINGFKVSTSGNFGFIENQMIKTARLGLVASNADYTIIDFKVYSSANNPLMAFVGDNYVSGYNQDYAGFLLPKLNVLVPYQFTSYVANGGNINNLASAQLQEALKLNPKYVVLSSLSLMDGKFINTSPDYAVWYSKFTNIINQIIAKKSIPVLIKSAPGGIYAANKPAWDTFVDQQVALFPQTKVLDMRTLPFLWNDSFGLPGASDMTLMANAVNQFLIAEGY